MRTSKIVLHSTTHATPVGELTLIASDWGLRAVLWPADSAKRVRISTRPRLNADHPVLARAVRQLDEYFEGSRTGFDVPLDLDGTPFQLAAWQALTMIPFGTTTTYRQQAVNLGIPSAARALGAATHANPVSIIIPCHRVIGSDGTLTGFAGGLPTKQSLLDHEARVVARGRRKDNGFFTFDWRAIRPLHFGDRYTLLPMVEMFNSFNNRNNVNPLVTPGLFNFDGFLRQGVGDPLQVQLALKFTF